jgi:hypothetical protein
LAAAVLGSAVLQMALQYRLNYWSRNFFDAFGRRDASAVREQALLFVVLVILSVLAAILSIWARMTTQRKWRAWLTRHLIDRWLSNDRFRRLSFQQGEDRNPEYRITEDARVATDGPVSMAGGLLVATATSSSLSMRPKGGARRNHKSARYHSLQDPVVGKRRPDWSSLTARPSADHRFPVIDECCRGRRNRRCDWKTGGNLPAPPAW